MPLRLCFTGPAEIAASQCSAGRLGPAISEAIRGRCVGSVEPFVPGSSVVCLLECALRSPDRNRRLQTYRGSINRRSTLVAIKQVREPSEHRLEVAVWPRWGIPLVSGCPFRPGGYPKRRGTRPARTSTVVASRQSRDSGTARSGGDAPNGGSKMYTHLSLTGSYPTTTTPARTRTRPPHVRLYLFTSVAVWLRQDASAWIAAVPSGH